MHNTPPDENDRRAWTMETLETLIGSQGRAGLIGKETIATALGVSESTVSRWARGDGIPDDEAYFRLRWLARQRRTWYLRVCDFVLAVWTPLGRSETHERNGFDEAIAAERYFSEVTFRPTKDPSIVQCEVKLASAFRSFALVVLGPRRHMVELAHTADGPSARTLHFDRRRKIVPRQSPPSLKKGSTVEFFLRYLV